MHRRLRHLLRPTTIILLTALTGVGAMWLRSRYRADSVYYNWHRDDQTNEWRFTFRSERGQMMVAFFKWTPDYYLSPFSKIIREHGLSVDSWELESPSGDFWSKWAWSKWAFNEAWSGNREAGLIIPYWLLTLVLLAGTAAHIVRTVRCLPSNTDAAFPVCTGEAAGSLRSPSATTTAISSTTEGDFGNIQLDRPRVGRFSKLKAGRRGAGH